MPCSLSHPGRKHKCESRHVLNNRDLVSGTDATIETRITREFHTPERKHYNQITIDKPHMPIQAHINMARNSKQHKKPYIRNTNATNDAIPPPPHRNSTDPNAPPQNSNQTQRKLPKPSPKIANTPNRTTQGRMHHQWSNPCTRTHPIHKIVEQVASEREEDGEVEGEDDMADLRRHRRSGDRVHVRSWEGDQKPKEAHSRGRRSPTPASDPCWGRRPEEEAAGEAERRRIRRRKRRNGGAGNVGGGGGEDEGGEKAV